MHGKSLCTVWLCCDPETALQKSLKMKEQGHARVRRKWRVKVEIGGATSSHLSQKQHRKSNLKRMPSL